MCCFKYDFSRWTTQAVAAFLCMCLVYTMNSWTHGCNSWCHEPKQTWAAQALWLFNDVPVPNLALTSLRVVVPSEAGRTEHTSAHLLQCKVQQPDFVTRSLGDQASVWGYILLSSFSECPPKNANFHKDGPYVLLSEVKLSGLSTLATVLLSSVMGFSRALASVITGFSVLFKSTEVFLHF